MEGRLSIAPGIVMEEDDAGFVPEGAWSGPRTDGPELRLALVLQFGGASGNAYLSSARLVRGRDELGHWNGSRSIERATRADQRFPVTQ